MHLSNGFITARAHTNIALIKYWGKKNDDLIIPNNNSLSLTLDEFYTDTSVKFSNELSKDSIFLDDVDISNSTKIVNFLDIIREKASISEYAYVKSYNHVPTSAGLASSASGFAALAAAASKAAGLQLTSKELSKLARRGSGSATRSIFGGFAEWIKGNTDNDSYGVEIENPVTMDINMIAVVLNDQPKKISSRVGMKRSVETSPYYNAWVKQCEVDLIKAKTAIKENDFNTLGKISESNAMRMHALTMSAEPAFMYFNNDSIQVINSVKTLRENGVECYFTMDAGPNVKIICKSKDIKKIKAALTKTFNDEQIVVSKPGCGVQFIN
ncbi:diphosphomevalonate decarboxylase [Apilactobacillus ozensis]|uniref:diphosphomevalonate decarboxylase n=1 Tax=Apilactobacillus ozensis TaxID=866801 RepID=UPI00200AF9B4|nr:diphosphomevalonate decarboxylase [Apilactobacillus ozensis]MCK8606535.1 diphosphomevalonate decarboxylase [Apilactobacillus ozensis]